MMNEPNQKERDLKETIARRKAHLRESLKLKAIDSEVDDKQDSKDAAAIETTSFSSNTKALFETLKERRLKRKGQLPPLSKASPQSRLSPSLQDMADLNDSSDHTLADRLKQKLQEVKETVDQQYPVSSEMDPPPRRKLRGLRNQPKVTRFDDSLPDERYINRLVMGDQMEVTNQLRKKALYETMAVKDVRQKQAHIVDQQAYDFFTSEIENYAFPGIAQTHVDHSQSPISTPEESSMIPTANDETEQEGIALREELLEQIQNQLEQDESVEGEVPLIGGPYSNDSQQLLLPSSTRYMPHRERLTQESKNFFIPSTTPVSAEMKTPHSEPPHYLEDEGLYVGERPHVLWTNQTAMENRLLRRKDKGVGWFGDDARLLVQPNPLAMIHSRPQVLHYTGKENVITFRRARHEVYSQKLINKGSEETEFQLEVELSTLHFMHYPLFSVEHVLASKLQQACKQLSKKKKDKAPDYYNEKLQGLRLAVLDLKQAVHNQTDLKESNSLDVHSQLLEYRKELRRVRQKRKDALAIEHELLKSILKTWQQLKALRDNQGYSSTTAWLTVRRLITNAVDEESQQRREIDDEVCELQDLFEQENREKMATFEKEFLEWKSYEKARRRALRQAVRSQQQQQQQASELGTEESVEEGSQTSLIDPMATVPPERPRPSPPPVFDEAEVKGELMEYYRSHHKLPGEPLLVPEFRHNHPISQLVPRPEQQRREEIGRMKFHVRVLFNNQPVSQTKEITLNSDSTGDFNETFTLRIVQWPESIKLQVYESGLISASLLAEVYVPIPEIRQTMESGAEQEPYHFSTDRVVEYSHSAVGSGQLDPALSELGILVTSGVVNVAVCWGVDDSGKTLCPPGLAQQMAFNSNHVDVISSLGMTGVSNLQEVKKWIELSRLDPNDPRNMELLHLLESIPSTSEQDHYFRLVSVDESERFVSEKEFDSNRRFAVLKMRDDGHPGLKNESVPIDSRLISESMWRSATNFKPYADYDLPLLYFGDFHGVRKEEQNRFLLDVRERVLSHVRSGRGNLTLDDVVHCDIAPNISAVMNSVREFTSPRRPLNPVRKVHRKPKPLTVHVTNAKIVIQVVRAFNIPTRTAVLNDGMLPHPLSAFPGHHPPSLSLPSGPSVEASGAHDLTTTGGPSSQPSTAGLFGEDIHVARLPAEELIVVCPYVEVGFRESVVRTSTACGPSPFWNEEISLQFMPPHNNFSPSNLQKVTDTLHISLFDEVVTDILKDDRQRHTNVHHRIEKKWLGTFTLPFSTLHQRGRIEGTFQLDVPIVLLGYNRTPQDSTHFQVQNASNVDGLKTVTHTFLQLFITMEPLLSVLPPIENKFETLEDSDKIYLANVWKDKLTKRFPKRSFYATAVDISGRNVFVTRFVKAQNPPEEIAPPQDTDITVTALKRLSHYVSLIPFLADALTFSGACDIWTTSDQFLRMLAGDEEEHALLLCNYFLFCGLKAWIVFGHGVPEGDTTYVLTEAPGNRVGYWLWNASSGHHFAQHEPYIPLKSVGCVVNQHNVWANIQEYEDPGRIVFDLSNSSHWRPLFPTGFQPLSSVQQDLHYAETDNVKVKELQERIERAIHDRITTLRDRFITRWNRHCTQLLHTLLPKLEENLVSYTSNEEHHIELAKITTSYKLTGFPIHSPYTDIQNLLVRLERTGVHLCEDKQVEYALAVYVHPYPNDVISVWVYIASLVPK